MQKHRHAQPTEAAQGYLLTLRSMTSLGTAATTAGLARRLGVSIQAASQMVARLESAGLVRVGDARDLSLTPAGRVAADTIFRRHALLEWLLTRVVGLGWAESDEEAMRLQVAVSPRVEAAIAELVGHPRTCPHGNPIDARAARLRPNGIALSEADTGERLTILRITEEAEEDAKLLVYLEEQGLLPGVRVTVVEVSASRESITLDGPLGRSTMGLRPAGLIRVLRGPVDPQLFHEVPAAVARLRTGTTGAEA